MGVGYRTKNCWKSMFKLFMYLSCNCFVPKIMLQYVEIDPIFTSPLKCSMDSVIPIKFWLELYLLLTTNYTQNGSASFAFYRNNHFKFPIFKSKYVHLRFLFYEKFQLFLNTLKTRFMFLNYYSWFSRKESTKLHAK